MIDDARRVIDEAIRGGVFPAASAEVGTSAGPVWHHAAGTLTFDRGAASADVSTPFDLASLTKVIATTVIVMDLVAAGRLRLEERLADSFAEWRGADRESVTVRDALEHATGLPARLVDAPPSSRREFEHEICATRLEYLPRTRSIYSDLGFILLGFLAADRGRASLATQFDALLGHVPLPHDLMFALSPEARRRAAPTLPMDDDLRRGRILMGEVHDNYASALGGVAGHAGLFGTAPAVGAFARASLRAARGDAGGGLAPALMSTFVRKTTVPGSSRALGWDTMLPTSSCGTRMSASAFGHVGFTGTSLWVDPDRDRYYVLLTNRVCGAGSLDDMRRVRRAFHDALHDE